jgi:hypothetical protein
MKLIKIKLLTAFIAFSFAATSQSFLELTYPNNGNVIEVNTKDSIKWKSTNVNLVKLEYCTSFNVYPGPNVWKPLSVNISASTGYFLWDIPDTLAAARLRVVDASNPNVYDISDGDVSFWNPITAPKEIKLLSPNGGEILSAESSYFNIEVKATNVTMMGFEYSIDNGQNWVPIDTLVYNEIPMVSFSPVWLSFNWKVPNINSSQCKIRVFEKSNMTIVDESDNNFTISKNPQKKLELLSPNVGSLMFPINNSLAITWSSLGLSNVKIEYATSYSYTGDLNDYEWKTIISSTPANNQNYNWTVPPSILSTSRIRISDANDNRVYDISDISFGTYDSVNNPIIPVSISLTSLNGGEILKTSSNYFNISWKYEGNPSTANISLQLSNDNGQSWQDIDEKELSYGGYSYPINSIWTFKTVHWKIPNLNSNQCKIRVVNLKDNSVLDISNNTFAIQNTPSKELELLSPNSGQLAFYSQNDIKWYSKGITSVKIEYTDKFNMDFNTPNNWKIITNSTSASSGSYNWTVPNELLTGVRFRISDASNPDIYEISDMDISTYDAIASPKELFIVTPNGGETLLGGSIYNNISWMYRNTFNITRLEYTIDNGQSWEEISSYIITMPNIFDHLESTFVFASWYSVNWEVPNVDANNCRVRIIDTGDNSIIDESDNLFSIVKNPLLNGTEKIYLNTGLKVFPNPTNNIVNLQAPSNILTYQVYNAIGILICNKKSVNSKETTIDLSTYENGHYLLKVYTDKSVFSSRIIKVN